MHGFVALLLRGRNHPAVRSMYHGVEATATARWMRGHALYYLCRTLLFLLARMFHRSMGIGHRLIQASVLRLLVPLVWSMVDPSLAECLIAETK